MRLLPLLTTFIFHGVLGDIYLHNPRGSNNRLHEKSANRDNANRLFNSENNNRGGYNAGDKTNQPSGNNENNQYRMKYFQSGADYKVLDDGQGESQLTIEWTNQHGCGGDEDTDPHKQNCNLVLQYMCQPDVTEAAGTEAEKHQTMRNGVTTQTQNYNGPNKNTETEAQSKARQRNNVQLNRGLHEPWSWYDKCYIRERNYGLFTADQDLKKNKLEYSNATNTRQNPDGSQYGYECPEEKDYYPYWHPTPWKDIAILASDTNLCSHYTVKSFNVQPYHECVEYWDAGKTRRKHYSRWPNSTSCQQSGGTWMLLHNYLEKATRYTTQKACDKAGKDGINYVWAVPHDSDTAQPECLVALDKPHCQHADWSRSNHLGNGRYAEANNYTWTLPYFPSGDTQRCVLRIRYNISTDDYHPHETDYRHNEDKENGVYSPVTYDPYIDVGSKMTPLRLAVNTAQFGRGFQDRTHLFHLRPRPKNTETSRIYNLNVRGKRGNIVQVYPAVEYDFFPNPLTIRSDDLVHVQWTGSNTHNNGNPAGDGQSGSDGEGTEGTDRQNLVQIRKLDDNFPVPLEQSTLWDKAEVVWIHHGKNDIKSQDLAIGMASAGYFVCLESKDCPEAKLSGHTPDRKSVMNVQLNNAPASYEGALLRFEKGRYHFMCSRNSNFSNRSQKGTLVVL